MPRTKALGKAGASLSSSRINSSSGVSSSTSKLTVSFSSISSSRKRVTSKWGVSLCGLGIINSLTPLLLSMSLTAARFSLSRNAATSTGTTARTSPVRSLAASSCSRRRMARPRDFVSRIVPCPVQRGQTMALVSPKEGRKRWRDISSNPKREMRPT